jgi:hypothetical protein
VTLCACGCSRSTRSERATFATDRCRWRTEKRRARAAGSERAEIEVTICAVCGQELVRDARTRRRRYHDGCRATARKLLRDARENRAA